jgi:hypothetical protein
MHKAQLHKATELVRADLDALRIRERLSNGIMMLPSRDRSTWSIRRPIETRGCVRLALRDVATVKTVWRCRTQRRERRTHNQLSLRKLAPT